MPGKCRQSSSRRCPKNLARCCATLGRRFNGSKVTSRITRFIAFTLRQTKRWSGCTRSRAVFPRIEFPKCVPLSIRPLRNRRSDSRSALLHGSLPCRHVLPVSWFAFRQPRDRRLQSFLTRLVAFGFGHPLHVFSLIAWAKVFERLSRFRIFVQGGGEIIRNLRWRFSCGF